MAITLGKKSMEVEGLFNSFGGLVYKPIKVEVEASETPKETIINVHVTIQCERSSWWKRINENFKRLFRKSNGDDHKSDG